MKNKLNYRLGWLVTACLITPTLLVGCTTSSETKTEEMPKIQLKPSGEQLSKEEQEKIVKKIEEFYEKGYRPTDLEKEISPFIQKMDKEHGTKIIHLLVKSIEENVEYFYQLMPYLEYEIRYTNELDTVEDKVKNSDKISNRITRGFIEEMKRQHIQVTLEKDYFSFELDGQYILNKYNSFLKGDLKDYLQLMAKHQKTPIYDNKKKMFDLEVLREDLVFLENGQERWESGDMAENFKNLERLTYETFFGLNHTTFYDLDIKKKGDGEEEWIYTIKPDIKKQYQQIAQEYADMTFAKDLEAFLEVLEKNNDRYTDAVHQYLEEFLSKKFPESKADSSETINEAELNKSEK